MIGIGIEERTRDSGSLFSARKRLSPRSGRDELEVGEPFEFLFFQQREGFAALFRMAEK